ncbi:MAG: hypothetical protein IJN62_03120 [Clostridia bacterium]|nr:hypothetical protein [Clostridia bacterium]
MINCDKARELSNAYIDGELDEESSCAYEEHISCCEVCHEEYDMLKRVSADLSLTTAPVPEGFARRLHTALVNEQFKKENKTKKVFAFPYYKAASVMAAALVIAVVGKYGVYDTYKNVAEDTNRAALEMSGKVAEEVIDVPEIEPIEEKEVENKKQEPVYTTKTVAPQNKEPEQLSKPVETDTVDVVNTTAETDVVVYTEEIAPQTEVDVTAHEEQIPLTDSAPMVRMAEPTVTAEVAEETGDAEPVAEDISSGGGSSATKEVTELIPAEIVIYNNGDAAMIMFKKFLLTILDSSQITDNGGEIIVNITADEYESVMQHLRANEYVKSVTEGTSFDGKAVINIK